MSSSSSNSNSEKLVEMAEDEERILKRPSKFWNYGKLLQETAEGEERKLKGTSKFWNYGDDDDDDDDDDDERKLKGTSKFWNYGDDDDDEALQFKFWNNGDDDDDEALQLALLQSCLSDSQEDSQEENPIVSRIIDSKGKGISSPLTPLPPDRFLKQRGLWGYTKQEVGESSVVECVICKDKISPGTVLVLRSYKCRHSFCENCIINYVGEKLQEDLFEIECPEEKCKETLEQRMWQQFVPERLLWLREQAITEGSVLAQPDEFSCPFEDCSKTIVDDGRKFLIRACPYCKKLYCRKCLVKWHKGKTCEEYSGKTRKIYVFLKPKYSLRPIQIVQLREINFDP